MADLIPTTKVKAQEIDSVAQPTFGPLEIIGGDTASASVEVKSDVTSIQRGETFVVKIQVKTGETGASINKYKVVVGYDNSKLTVVDQDNDTTGSQLKLLDTVFEIEDPIEENNFVTQEGEVVLSAATPSGNALQVNRVVAEIEFQAQSNGPANIWIKEGIDGTQLINRNGVGIGYTSNQISITVNEQADQSTTQSPVDNGNGINTQGQTGTVIPAPDTAIPEDARVLLGVFGGIAFIALGITLIINKSDKKN